jgi:hypothetical protein
VKSSGSFASNWVRFVILTAGRGLARSELGTIHDPIELVRADRGDPNFMCFLPERGSDRLDPVLAPPCAFIAAPVKIAVMRPAQWDCELVTDPLSESPRLRKAQMMRVAWLPATDEAGPFGHQAQVLSIALPQRFWDCERSPMSDRWFTWIDLFVGLMRVRSLT